MLLCRDYLILFVVPELEPDWSDPDAALQGLFDPFLMYLRLEPDSPDNDVVLQGLFDPFGCT